MKDQNQEGWHLDRRVPLALITALLIQTGGVIWWAANLSSRVDTLESWVRDNRVIGERLAVIEQVVQLSREDLKEIKGSLKGRP